MSKDYFNIDLADQVANKINRPNEAIERFMNTYKAAIDSISYNDTLAESLNSIVSSIKDVYKTYDISNSSVLSNMQSLVQGVSEAVSASNALHLQSVIDVFKDIDYSGLANIEATSHILETIPDDITVDTVSELIKNGEITDEDFQAELKSTITGTENKAVKDKPSLIKKALKFVSIQLIVFLMAALISPVTDKVKEEIIETLRVNEFWQSTEIIDWIDSWSNENHTATEDEAKATVDESKTGNISKQKREDLLSKVKEIRNFISNAPQDENTGNLLSYLSEIEKDINGKKYGLVFEEHREDIDEVLETHTPVLTEETDLFIDNGGQMNFLIEGDNLASLKLLEKTHKGRIDLIYIDPPYNTGASNWIYDNDFIDSKDLFKHSKWLSMMKARLNIAQKLLSRSGVLICAIDENESATLRLLLEEIFGEGYEYDCVTIIHNPRGIQGKNFSYTNEFAYFVIPKGDRIIGNRRLSDNEIYWSPLRNWGGESLRIDAKNCFYPIYIKDSQIVSFGEVCSSDYHPKRNEVLDDGTIAIYPIDSKGIERKWRYARQSVEGIKDFLSVKKAKGIFDIVIGKTFGTYKTVWSDPKYDANGYGKQLLNSILPDCSFDFPKSLWNVYDCIYAVVAQKQTATILDFFAGSGTTGHAVMKLNAEDGGNRKFILCTNNENNICRDVTYERIKRVIDKEKYAASLKYYKVDYLPISERMYYEYADELLLHIRELVELENGINFIGNTEIAIVLTDEELDDFTQNIEQYSACRKLYMGHDLLPDEDQERIIEENNIEINIIPDYYYRDLQEA